MPGVVAPGEYCRDTASTTTVPVAPLMVTRMSERLTSRTSSWPRNTTAPRVSIAAVDPSLEPESAGNVKAPFEVACVAPPLTEMVPLAPGLVM